MGVLLVFMNIYFQPQSEAAAVEKGLGVVEIRKLYDRLSPYLFGTHWDAEDCKCASTPMNIDGWV